MNLDQTNRPLNEYVRAVEVFHCPADKGDFLYNAKDCFQEFGNSYLVQFQQDSFRVKHVAGDARLPRGMYEATPIKTSEVGIRPTSKIIQGDWPWHANRGVVDPKSIWHNFKGQSRFNMLFGDGHVAFYRFPKEMPDWTYSGSLQLLDHKPRYALWPHFDLQIYHESAVEGVGSAFSILFGYLCFGR